MVVYLMEDAEGRYKIGVSGNPERRRRAIELKQGINIELVTTIGSGGWRGDYKLESALHEQFSDKNLVNEWFDLDQEDIDSLINEDYIHRKLVDLYKQSPESELIEVE